MITIGIGLEDYDELENVKKLCIEHNVQIRREKDFINNIFIEIDGHWKNVLIIQDYIEKVNQKKYYKKTWLGKLFYFILGLFNNKKKNNSCKCDC